MKRKKYIVFMLLCILILQNRMYIFSEEIQFNIETEYSLGIDTSEDYDNLYVELNNRLGTLNQQYINGMIDLNTYEKIFEEEIAPLMDTTAEKNAVVEGEVEIQQKSPNNQIDGIVEYRTTRKKYNIFGKDITSKEIILCNWYRIECGVAALTSYEALEEVDKRYYHNKVGYNDNGDAFRHSYWSALMARRIGTELAYRFGLAHENLDRGYNWAKLNDDVKMDVSNNFYGRKKGVALMGYRDITVANNLEGSVTKGWLKRLSNPSNRTGYWIKTSGYGRR